MKTEDNFTPGGFYSKGYNREQALESINDGWHGIVNEIFDKWEALNKPVVIDQVKEKLGGLRIYTSPRHEELENFITEMEHKSFTICEQCGSAGKLRSGGWWRTLCDEHANGRPAIHPFNDEEV